VSTTISLTRQTVNSNWIQ